MQKMVYYRTPIYLPHTLADIEFRILYITVIAAGAKHAGRPSAWDACSTSRRRIYRRRGRARQKNESTECCGVCLQQSRCCRIGWSEVQRQNPIAIGQVNILGVIVAINFAAGSSRQAHRFS